MDYWLILLHGCFTNFCVNYISEQFTESVPVLQIALPILIFLTVSVLVFFLYQVQFFIRFNSLSVSCLHLKASESCDDLLGLGQF